MSIIKLTTDIQTESQNYNNDNQFINSSHPKNLLRFQWLKLTNIEPEDHNHSAKLMIICSKLSKKVETLLFLLNFITVI